MPSLPVLEDVSAFDLAGLPLAAPAALYVHVPFCFHKCHYCDFYSITRQSPERMARFVDLVLAEADLWGQAAVERSPTTVFFGGGTPSLLPYDEMARLLDGLCERFDLSGVREWTVEVNPATADLAYLRMMRSRGVDRISLGAQSFHPGDLAMLERHHDPADVGRAVALSREAGFERISLDLIYAIPGQTLQTLGTSLHQALALGTDHLSCYGLTYEPNTPMTVRRRLGRIKPVEDDLEVQMFRLIRTLLRDQGLLSYEISNYSRPGQESLHNLAYWRGESYVSLGPSAASHVEGVRFRNRPHLSQWEQAITAGHLAAVDVERLTPSQRAGELAMLNLRLTRGIDFVDFARRTGHDPCHLFREPVERLSALGLIDVTAEALRLTETAWPVADAVAAEFLQVAVE